MLDKLFFAMSQRPTGGAEAPAGPASAFVNLFPIIMIFGIFYFLLIRPQQKKQKEHGQMVAALQVGDEVRTAGGVLGRITGNHYGVFTGRDSGISSIYELLQPSRSEPVVVAVRDIGSPRALP